MQTPLKVKVIHHLRMHKKEVYFVHPVVAQSMEFNQILSEFPPESGTLEYKRKRANKRSIIRELVALANADGGKLLYGVHEDDGEITGFDDFPDYSSYEEDISNILTDRVSPVLDVTIQEIEHDDTTLMGFSIESSSLLHTFRDDKPHIPQRFESRIINLKGSDIAQYYRAHFADSHDQSSPRQEWLRRLRKEARKIKFQDQDNDFSDSQDRTTFARTVNDVGGELVELLESAPASVRSQTTELALELLESCRSLSEKETSATPNIHISDIMGGIGRDDRGGAPIISETIPKKLRRNSGKVRRRLLPRQMN